MLKLRRWKNKVLGIRIEGSGSGEEGIGAFHDGRESEFKSVGVWPHGRERRV